MRVDGVRVSPEEAVKVQRREPRAHVPEVGSKLSVTLPGETTRSTVEEVLDPRTLVVKLDVMEPMAKSHGFRFNDRVVVVYRLGIGRLPLWEAQAKAD